MANTGNTQQQIDYGAAPNDGTGNPLRTAFIKTDENFDNIWLAGPVGSNITILNNSIQVNNTNGNLILSPNGVGNVQFNRDAIPRLNNTYNLGGPSLRWRGIFLGTDGINSSGNITANNVFSTGIISAVGNISTSSNLLTGQQVIANGQIQTGTGFFTAGYLSVTGNTALANLSATGNITSAANVIGNTVSATGNVVAGGYLKGDGQFISNISVAGGTKIENGLSYANATVPSGNVTIGANGAVWTFATAGNLVLPSNTSSINYANGAPYGGGGAPNFIVNGNSYANIASLDGNLVVGINGNNWTFGTDGNLTLPGNIIAINYANGNRVTGNVTFSDQIVIGTGISNLVSGLYLAPSGSSANAEQYLRVRGDVTYEPTHIHFDTGNNQYFNQFIGDDNKYVLLSNTGNIVINTDNYVGNSAQWTFGTDGTTQFPGNLLQAPDGNPLEIKTTNGNNRAVFQAGNGYAVTGVQDDVSGAHSAWAYFQTDISNVNAPTASINVVPADTGTEVIWAFNADGALTLPGSSGQIGRSGYTNGIDLYNNNGGSGYVRMNYADESLVWADPAGAHIQTSETYTWDFDTNGTLTLPYGAVVKDSSVNAITIGDASNGRLAQGQNAVAIGTNAGSGLIIDTTYVSGAEDPSTTLIVSSTAGILPYMTITGTGFTSNQVVLSVVDGSTLTISAYADSTPSGTLTFSAGPQQSNSVAIGTNAGRYDQERHNVAIGTEAGMNNQGEDSVAIGWLAGRDDQTRFGIAIGWGAGQTTQGQYAQAYGVRAGGYWQKSDSIAIGAYAGQYLQGQTSVAIGYSAGSGARQGASVENMQAPNIVRLYGSNTGLYPGMTVVGGSITPNSGIVISSLIGGEDVQFNSNPPSPLVNGDSLTFYGPQGAGAVAIGLGTGEQFQGQNAVAVGYRAGQTKQGNAAVSIGEDAGYTTQGAKSVSIGPAAGFEGQGTSAIAMGWSAGRINQGVYSIAIGNGAGFTGQGAESVALGLQAGYDTQGANAVAIGNTAGLSAQGNVAIAIGAQAGYTTQGQASVAMGFSAGYTGQGNSSVALGEEAGYTGQGHNSIAIGRSAGQSSQGNSAIAMGWTAAQTTQGNAAVAIGEDAGRYYQGEYSIAIGRTAGFNLQANNSIILNATGLHVNAVTANSFIVKPIRSSSAGNVLYYDEFTGEITYNIAATSSISNGTSNVSIPVANGNVIVNANDSEWDFNTNGELILSSVQIGPEATQDPGNPYYGEQTGLLGTRRVIAPNSGIANQVAWSTVISSADFDTPVRVFQASTTDVVAFKMTIRIQHGLSAVRNLQVADVFAAKDELGEVTYTVSNRIKTDITEDDVIIDADADEGNGIMIIKATASDSGIATAGSYYFTYDVVEFNQTYD